jgi:hypothetical protein
MGVYWLAAPESAAAAAAKSEARGVYDWPSLSMPFFPATGLSALRAVLGGDAGDRPAVTGVPLASDAAEGTAAALVLPEFIDQLAGLTEPDVRRAAAGWENSPELAGWQAGSAVEVLTNLASFAASARSEGVPVLQVTD